MAETTGKVAKSHKGRVSPAKRTAQNMRTNRRKEKRRHEHDARMKERMKNPKPAKKRCMVTFWDCRTGELAGFQDPVTKYIKIYEGFRHQNPPKSAGYHRVEKII